MSSTVNRAQQLDASLTGSFIDDSGLPTWDDLKLAPGTDYKCAWGLFDKHGKPDQVSTLNLLTPEQVLNVSRSEIRTGESVSLNWGLENVKYSGFGRAPMKQNIIDLGKLGFCGHDDEVSFNTQCGSQVGINRQIGVEALADQFSGMVFGMFLIRAPKHTTTI